MRANFSLVLLRLALVAALLACAGVSRAAPITFQYTGTVAFVSVDDIYGDIAFGDVFEVAYTFDSTATDLIPGDPATASYLSSGVPFSMTVLLAGHTFTAADSVSIGVVNSFVDQYTVTGFGSGGNLTMEIFFQDDTATAFADDSLPLTKPALSLFPFATFRLHEIGAEGEVQVDGLFTSAAPVPEPSTGFALCLGIAGLLVLSRRRHGAKT
jgi:hypothetical protein